MIDLKAIAKRRGYRIEVVDGDGPRIPGRRAMHVWQAGETDLAVYVDTPNMMTLMEAVPGVRVSQRGDREANYRFGPDLLDTICGMIGAKRFRRMTPEQGIRASAHLAPHRFQRVPV